MDAWLLLKQAICSDHCLAYPDYSKGFLLFVDAAVGRPLATPAIRGGISGILAQTQDGVTRPISYFSRQLRQSEIRYNGFNAELLAVVASLEHYYPIIKSQHVVVYSDHLPLVRASEPKPKEQRKTLNNLIQKLNELNVEIKHISGSGNIADPLSRSPVETPEEAPVA